MNRHPYLRAYMAGIAFPTLFLMLGFVAFMIAHYWLEIPVAIERAIVFPLAFVPNLWGLWNMLYLGIHHSHSHWPVGAHGGLVPLLLVPIAYAVAREAGLSFFTPSILFIVWPGLIAVYYLVWKYIVSFLNEFMGIA